MRWVTAYKEFGQFYNFIGANIDVSLLLLTSNGAHNFIAYVPKRGDFLKSCWSKWTSKQVAFFCSNCERGKDQHFHVQTPCVTVIFKQTTKMANSQAFMCKLCDNTTHRKGLVTWPGLARFVGLASSGKVTFIPVLHELGQPGATIFIS